MTLTPQEIAEAQLVTDQIKAKVDELLAPLKSEMARLNWPPDFQAIMWHAVEIEARRLQREAAKQL